MDYEKKYNDLLAEVRGAVEALDKPYYGSDYRAEDLEEALYNLKTFVNESLDKPA